MAVGTAALGAVGLLAASVTLGPAREGAPAQPGPTLGGSEAAARIAENSRVLPGRQVWAHTIPHGLADYHEVPGRTDYGTRYPLDLIPGGYGDPRRPGAGVPRAQAAGITGMQVMQFEGVNRGSDFMGEWMGQADPTWADADASNDFSVAPCLLVSTRDGLRRMLEEYVAFAAHHPSAAKIGSKYVVYIYGTPTMPAAEWAAVREEIDVAGHPVFLIGDLQTASSQRGYRVDAARLDTYARYFDAVWNFEDSNLRIWNQVQSYVAGRGLAYAGGIMPGYNRETSDAGGFVDAAGTSQFRRQWEAALAAGAPWQNVLTWNDMVERTDIAPSSDWNITRSDINAFYSAAFRGVPAPKRTPELYVTTPDHVRAGEAIKAEGLVLNGSTRAVNLHMLLKDGAGRVVGGRSYALARPGVATAATTSVSAPAAPAAAGAEQRYVRAHVWTTDSAGAVVQRVISAPVLIHGAGEGPRSTRERTHYYSIPASRWWEGKVGLTLTGNPAAGPARATVTAPGGASVRFAEVLQNHRQAALGFDVASFTAPVPVKDRTVIGGQQITVDAAGAYLARVIGSDERVAYSDPVLVARPQG